MTDAPQNLVSRAAALREQFDRSFAQPQHMDLTPREDFLCIRLGSAPYALRLSEIAGLFADKKITKVPGRQPVLFGIAGFRGAIVPVYSLPTYFGFPIAPTPRWVAISSAAPIAWAFEEFDGHQRCPRTAIAARGTAQSPDRGDGDFVKEYICADDTVRPIVDIRSIIDGILRHAPTRNASQEN
jgi:purine-binding chemotaxis protein CheW